MIEEEAPETFSKSLTLIGFLEADNWKKVIITSLCLVALDNSFINNSKEFSEL